MKVYISGPISGTDDYMARFGDAEKKLNNLGHDPVSPIVIGDDLESRLYRKPTWQEYMREDIKALMDCDAIYMLDGWLASDGAKLEYQLSVEVGIKRIEL